MLYTVPNMFTSYMMYTGPNIHFVHDVYMPNIHFVHDVYSAA